MYAGWFTPTMRPGLGLCCSGWTWDSWGLGQVRWFRAGALEVLATGGVTGLWLQGEAKARWRVVERAARLAFTWADLKIQVAGGFSPQFLQERAIYFPAMQGREGRGVWISSVDMLWSECSRGSYEYVDVPFSKPCLSPCSLQFLSLEISP